MKFYMCFSVLSGLKEKNYGRDQPPKQSQKQQLGKIKGGGKKTKKWTEESRGKLS